MTEIGVLAGTVLLGAIVFVPPYLAAVAVVKGSRLPDLASPGRDHVVGGSDVASADVLRVRKVIE